ANCGDGTRPAVQERAPGSILSQQIDRPLNRVPFPISSQINLDAGPAEPDREVAFIEFDVVNAGLGARCFQQRSCRDAATVADESPDAHERADRNVKSPFGGGAERGAALEKAEESRLDAHGSPGGAGVDPDDLTVGLIKTELGFHPPDFF